MYEIYSRLARTYGLTMSPADPGMMTFEIVLTGSVDGSAVHVRRFCGSGAYVVVSSPYATHLDLGLGLGRASVLSGIAEWFGAEDIQVGDAAFDAAVTIRGDEPSRVRALLSAAVRAELGPLLRADFRLTDAECAVTSGCYDESYSMLEGMLGRVISAARAIDRARPDVPPAAGLRAHHQALVAISAARGWELVATPLWMQGSIGGDEVTLRGQRYSAAVRMIELVVAHPPLDERLVIDGARTKLDRIVGAPFVPTGDAAFDDAFDVHHVAADRVQRIADAEVRRRLLRLREVGAIAIHDQRAVLRADASQLDPERIEPTIEELRAVLELIRRNQEGLPPAYR
ncbi:MAG: hypothetical protein AB7S26_04270 [Sandaracinaceae bacterium]